MRPTIRTGSNGRPAGKRLRKALGLPQGSGYCVPLPRELLASPAWLVMSDQSRKLIDALMIEHADHAGYENGDLKAPYDMLVERGMRRGNILRAILELEALGIVDPKRGVLSYGSRKAPSSYRLTWLGTPDGLTPTNEWKAIKTVEEARARMMNAWEGLQSERNAKAKTRAARAAKRKVGRDAERISPVTTQGDLQ